MGIYLISRPLLSTISQPLLSTYTTMSLSTTTLVNEHKQILDNESDDDFSPEDLKKINDFQLKWKQRAIQKQQEQNQQDKKNQDKKMLKDSFRGWLSVTRENKTRKQMNTENNEIQDC